MSRLKCKLTCPVSGFSLIELLIAAVIGSIAVTAGFQLFIGQNKTQVIQANISDMQQNARSAVDELVDKISPGWIQTSARCPCITAWNSNPDTLAIAFMAEPICSARSKPLDGNAVCGTQVRLQRLDEFPSRYLGVRL